MKQRNTDALTRNFLAVEYSFLLFQWLLIIASIISFYYDETFFSIVFFAGSWLSFKFRKRVKKYFTDQIDKRMLEIKSFYARIGRRGRRKMKRLKEKGKLKI